MKSNENQKLSPRQLRVLPYLLLSPSYEEAARLSGITPKQIYTWLKQPDFQEELKKQRNDVFRNAITTLKIGTQKAVQTLISLLDDEDPRIRLLASEKVLSNAFKGLELIELAERVRDMEEIVKSVQMRKTP